MSENSKNGVKDWNSQKYRYESTGPIISAYHIARCMNFENFARFFDEFINLGGKGLDEGKVIGHKLRFTHRTLQRLAICFCLGVIVGLSEQEQSDARNAEAIATAKKLAQMLEAGELQMGPFL